MNVQRNFVAAAALLLAGGLYSGGAQATVVATPLTVGGGASEFDFNNGHLSTSFSFTVGAGLTDDFNISAAFDPSDPGEVLAISNSLNGGGFTSPVDYIIGSGIALAYTAGSWIVDVGLATEDPKNDFSLTAVAATPLTAALPLFAGGLGMLGLFGRRRKQKALNALAA